MHPPQAVAGCENVVAALGVWPSFHDAEVIAFALSRPAPISTGKTEARLTVHVRQYEPRDEGTVRYHLALVRSVLITFRFVGVEALEVSDFNHQNVIDAITFQDSRSPLGATLSVEVESIFGFSGRWHCRFAEVASVVATPGEA
jgi:Immunity protein 50